MEQVLVLFIALYGGNSYLSLIKIEIKIETVVMSFVHSVQNDSIQIEIFFLKNYWKYLWIIESTI